MIHHMLMQINGRDQISIVVQNIDAGNTSAVATNAKKLECTVPVTQNYGYESHVTNII